MFMYILGLPLLRWSYLRACLEANLDIKLNKTQAILTKDIKSIWTNYSTFFIWFVECASHWGVAEGVATTSAWETHKGDRVFLLLLIVIFLSPLIFSQTLAIVLFKLLLQICKKKVCPHHLCNIYGCPYNVIETLFYTPWV